ncbi:hypothetical protein DFQ26_009500 [Actinomortierella ambigua]|nr:hypothetical protein DFQ26_009500 [Actinomortierella ambigua]
MSSPVKAAATVQDGILLVQYSPTGNGIGNLYAIVLSDMKQPLPFQIQRQVLDLQAPKGAVASMSLASVPSFGGSNPTTPGTSPPAPPGSSPAAMAAVPPFRDVVLSVNAAGSSQAWHVKAPGRSVPPGATHDNPLAPLWGASKMPSFLFPNAVSISFGTHTPKGPQNPGILAVLQTSTEAQLTKIEYPAGSVNLGSPTSPSAQTPSSAPSAPLSGGNGGNSNTTATEQPVPWKQSWNDPELLKLWAFSPPQSGLIFHPTTVTASIPGGGGPSEVVAGQCPIDPADWCMTFLNDPPSAGKQLGVPDYKMALRPCFTSTSDELVAVAGNQVYVNKFVAAPRSWDPVNSANNPPNISGSVIACTASNNVVIVVVPGSDGTQSQPGIHFFDLKTTTWAKAQLVPAPHGTFSDIPPIPSSPGNSASPDKGSPDKGGGSNHSGDPSTADPSSVDTTTPRAALIGGIVGGIVVLGVLIFVGFFFSRRRGSKQKGQHQSELALKPLDGSDGQLHHEQTALGRRVGHE